MMPNGEYHQELGESNGTISEEIVGELKKPFFYSVFILNGQSKAFNQLSSDVLEKTYRYNALRKSLKQL